MESVFTFATHLFFLADIFLADTALLLRALCSTYDAFLMPDVVEPGGGNPTMQKRGLAWHSGCTFYLTPAVLGIDLPSSAVPSYLFLRSGSTERTLGSSPR